MKKVGIAVLVIAILVGVPVAGFFIVKNVRQSRAAARDAAKTEVFTSVEVTPARRGDITNVFTLAGTVEADHISHVVPKVPGKILRVNVEEGDDVSKGDLLVELERNDLQAQLKQAKAAVGSAEARLRQAQSGTGLQETETSTSIERARATLASAKARLQQAQTGADVTQVQTGTSVAQAKENLRQAKAALDILQEGAREQEKEQAKEAVRQAKASRDNAKQNLQRAEKLLAQGAMAQQQYDAAKLQYDVAAAQYNSAVQQQNLVEEGPRSQQVEQARARVEQARSQLQLAQANEQQNRIQQQEIEAAKEQVRTAEAALKMARASTVRNTISQDDVAAARSALEQARANVSYIQAQIGYTYIRAPMSGTATAVEADPGEGASSADPVVTITDNASVFVRGSLPETKLQNAAVGDTVDVIVDALGKREFTGEITEIIPSADPDTRTFDIKVRLDNSDGRLHQGMYARIVLATESVINAILVPRDAVLEQQGKEVIYVVRNNRAERLEVETGLYDEQSIVVENGLQAGTQVVTAGQTLLRPGEKVKIAENSMGGGQ